MTKKLLKRLFPKHIRRSTQTAAVKLLYAIIALHADERGVAGFEIDWLCREFHMQERVLKGHLSALKKERLVKIEYQPDRRVVTVLRTAVNALKGRKERTKKTVVPFKDLWNVLPKKRQSDRSRCKKRFESFTPKNQKKALKNAKSMAKWYDRASKSRQKFFPGAIKFLFEERWRDDNKVWKEHSKSFDDDNVGHDDDRPQAPIVRM